MTQLASLVKSLVSPLGRLLPFAQGDEAEAPLQPLIRRRKPRTVMGSQTADVLQIPCPETTAEDSIRDKHLRHAQHLVRQERWEDLIARIETADRNRHMTPGTMPVAELLAYGARSDVVGAAEHALVDGLPPKDAPVLAGVEALEHQLAELDGDPVMACIVALTHMDIGWAWRGNVWDVEIPDTNREVFEAHFDRARDILSSHPLQGSDSPLLALSQCSLAAGINMEVRRKADLFEKLIALNPANPRPMRTLGTQMLPRWNGSYEELELEARRTASSTASEWGAGGYAWVQFDAVAYDDGACENLDVGFFIEGLRDILVRRSDPYTTNLLAAYCANAIGQSFSGNEKADRNRQQIAKCARWIVREHLTELHPMIWAHAARGFDNNLRVHSASRFAASGRDDALRLITSIFSSEISAGKRIVFTENGPVAEPA